MTRKDYEKLADVFRRYKLYSESFDNSPWRKSAHTEMVTRMADMLKQDNPRFDDKRFFETCGLE